MGKITKHYNSIILALLFILLGIGVFSLFVPFDRDEGTYAYIGSLWFEGKGIPYLSVFDPKTPLSYVFFGIGNALVSHSFFGIRFFALLYKCGILAVVYGIAKNITAKRIALTITVISGFYLLSLRLEGNAFNTEMHLLLPFLLFLLFLIKLIKGKEISYLFSLLAGICAGFAFLGKTVVLSAVFPFFLWFVILKRKIRASILIIIGFFIPIFCFGLYFFWQHASKYLYKYIYIYNKIYVREGFIHSQLFNPTGGISIPGIFSFITFLPDVITPLLLFALLGLYLTHSKKNLAWWVGTISIVGTWLGIKLGFRSFPHYFIPLSIVLCIALIPLFEVLSIKKYQHIFVGLFLLLIGIAFVPEIPTYAKGSYGVLYLEYGGQADWFSDALSVGNWIKLNKKNNETVLVWANEPEIYYYSNILSTTRYVNLYEFWYFPDDLKKWNVDMLKNQPTYIITYTNDPPSFVDVQQFLENTKVYKKIKTIGTYQIFKRI